MRRLKPKPPFSKSALPSSGDDAAVQPDNHAHDDLVHEQEVQGDPSLPDWDASDAKDRKPAEEDEPGDEPILLDHMDFEGKRVHLPCDEDGQVFLAPLRKDEPATSDDFIKPPFEEERAAAQRPPADQSPDTGSDLPLIDFGFLSGEQRDASLERTEQEEPVGAAEVVLDEPVDLPSPRAPTLEPLLTEDVALSPVMQGVQTIQNRWPDQPVIPPALDDAPAPGSPSPFKNFFGAIASLLGGAARLPAFLCVKLFAMLSSSIALTGVAIKALASRGSVLTMMAASSIIAAAKVGLVIGARFIRSASSILAAAALSVSLATGRLARSLAIASYRGLFWSGVRAKRHAITLATWSSVGAKASFLAMKTFGSACQSVLAAALKAGINAAVSMWSMFRRYQPVVRATAGVTKRRIGAALFGFGAGTARQFVAFNRKTYQFLKKSYEALSTSMRQVGGHGASYGAKGKFMATVRQLVGAAGSTLPGVTRVHMAGVAASGACLFLLMISWSDASTSRQAFVEMPFPPKPVLMPTESRQYEPHVLEWPSLKVSPEAFEASPTPSLPKGTSEEKIESNGGGHVSPDEVLAQSIDISPQRDAVTQAASTDVTPALTLGPAGAGADSRQLDDVRLMALTLLADIEAVAGLSEFTKAVRTVGLETLIEPGLAYTILVPTDAAFAKLGRDKLDALFDPSGHVELRALLSNHILSERLSFSDFAGRVGSYISLANQPITIAAAEVIKVDNASMIDTDLRAANTLIHVIDEILMPSQPLSSVPLRSPEQAEQASDI